MEEEVKNQSEVKEETEVKEEKTEVTSEKESKKEKKDKFRKELDAKNEEIAKLNEQVALFKDKYYRSIADLDNQRKQYEKEHSQLIRYAAQDLAEKLLPSFEMFSMVIEASDNLPPEVLAYVQGFDMVYRQMVQALESEGVSQINVKIGDEFDHNIHSAMETCEVEDEKMVNKVTKVIRKGYKIHDRLLKPAMVVVGQAKKVAEEEKKEEAQA